MSAPEATAGWAVTAALAVAAVALSACVERERAFLTTAPRDGPAAPGALVALAPVPSLESPPPPVPALKPDRPAAAPPPSAPAVSAPPPDWLLADRLPDQPPPVPPPDEPGLDPQRLIGLGFAQMAALLGQPARQDARPPAMAWTYNAATCALTVFFYPDIATREFRALTYELKTESASEAGQGRCLRELRPRL